MPLQAKNVNSKMIVDREKRVRSVRKDNKASTVMVSEINQIIYVFVV